MRKLRWKEVKALAQGHTAELGLEPSLAPFPQSHNLMNELPRTTHRGYLSRKPQNIPETGSAWSTYAHAQGRYLTQVCEHGCVLSLHQEWHGQRRVSSQALAHWVGSAPEQVTESGSDPVSHPNRHI